MEEEQASGGESDLLSRSTDGVDAFGRWLSRERELRGLAREEVARLTKLPPSVIEALESGEVERMPPRAYLLGCLRSYAMAVGLDADDVVLRWQEIEIDLGPNSTPQKTVRGQRALLAVIGLAAGLAATLLVAFSRCNG